MEEEQLTKMTYSEVCMACLNVSSNLKCLLLDTDLLTKFATFTNLEIEINENTSYFLCIFCEEKLISSYNYQQQCKKSYDIIKFGANKCVSEQQTTCYEKKNNVKKEKSNYVEYDSEIMDYSSEHNESDDHNDSTCLKETHLIDRPTDLKTFAEDEILAAVAEHKNKFHNLIFDCLFCNYTADGLKTLAVHVGLLHKEMKGKWCSRCNLVVENNVEDHINSHVTTSDCTLCGETVKLECMIIHLLGHSEVKRFTCKICSKVFLTSTSLNNHLETHNGSENYSSNEEDDRRNNTEISDENIDMSVEEKYCEICKKCVKSLELHLEKHHADKQNIIDEKYICDICETEFSTARRLKVHMKAHLGIAPFKCKHCDKRMMTRHQILEHERTHTGEKPYVCAYCGKRFTQGGALRTHVRQHTGKTEICNICDKTFCRKSELKLHKAKHAGFKPFLCTTCGQSFFQKSHLTDHSQIHSHIRPHKCDSCDKTFKQRSQLTAHMHIHTGTKPHVCEKCGEGFFTLFSLHTHEKTHEKQEYYQCDHCPRKFRNEVSCLLHVAKHEDRHSRLYEGDYQCKYCPRKFKKEIGLIRHLPNHEVEKPFKCMECTFSASKRLKLLKHIKVKHMVVVTCAYCSEEFSNKKKLADHLENTIHLIHEDFDENKE